MPPAGAVVRALGSHTTGVCDGAPIAEAVRQMPRPHFPTMKTSARRLLTVGLFLLPAPLTAQLGRETLPLARVIVTPLVGYRTPHSTGIELSVDSEFDSFSILTDEDRRGAVFYGGRVMVRAIDRLSVAASLARSSSARVNSVTREPGLPPESSFSIGPDLWLGSLGLSYRLPDPSWETRRFLFAGFVSVAPGVLREVPRENLSVPPEFLESVDNFTLSVSADASIALGTPNLAVSFGVQDYITFWNGDAHAEQFERFFERSGDPAEVSAEYDTSHIIVPQIGISLRF